MMTPEMPQHLPSTSLTKENHKTSPFHTFVIFMKTCLKLLVVVFSQPLPKPVLSKLLIILFAAKSHITWSSASLLNYDKFKKFIIVKLHWPSTYNRNLRLNMFSEAHIGR